MGIISSALRAVALGVAASQLKLHGKPYGVQDIRDLETRSGGTFAVTVGLFGDAPVRLTGTLKFFGDDSVCISSLNTGRQWLDMVANLHLLHKPLPLNPDQVRQLKTLWPD